MQTPISSNLLIKVFTALFLALTLAACGGGDDESRLDNINDNDGVVGGDGGDGEQEPEEENEPAQLGRGSEDNFVPGEIEVGIGDSALSPGGSTSLVVTMVNGSGELVTSAVDVSFNSDCIASNRAVLTSGGQEIGNTVSTSNGRAEVTYNADGCVGEDNITARATFEGESAGSARATITVESDTVQTLEFIGADPQLISLKGTGGDETSRVSFRVLGSTGSPMRDVDVNFALQPGGSGGLALVDDSDTSNGDGEVSTTVQSGTVATSVRVTATTEAGAGQIATQSDQLAVSTGIPDQNSMSLSASDLYPIAWAHDGEESELTIRLADAFNNPAPDGTAVSFTTSGGSIEGSCTTEGGACTVTWTSQSPRPEPSRGFIVNEQELDIDCPDPEGHMCRPGRVKVLATALGNESFIDDNGNGRYEHDSDTFLHAGNTNEVAECEKNAPQPYAEVDTDGCDDLGTAYLDGNFSKDYEEGEPIFALASGESGSDYETGDGVYNGVLCSDASLEAGECTRDTVTIRQDIMLVMAHEEPLLMEDGGLPGQQEVISLGLGQGYSVRMLLPDSNGNGMPAGTTVELNTSGLEGVQAEVVPDGELPGSDEPQVIDIQFTASRDEPPRGLLRFSVTAPHPNGELTTTIGQGIFVTCVAPALNSDGGLPGQPENIELGDGETSTSYMDLENCEGEDLPEGTELVVDGDAVEGATVERLSNPWGVRVSDDEGDNDPASGTIGLSVIVPSTAGDSKTDLPDITINGDN